MCGIAGFIHKSSCDTNCAELENKIHNLQACRGPDAQTSQTLIMENSVVHLFHQRLKVQDLSNNANQPMSSNDKSVIAVFNGEIYNAKEIAKTFLPNCPLRTKSDTEVLVEALSKRVIGTVLNEIRGMFAFGLVDFRDKTISLARDRFGEKPLHYWSGDDVFFFASQFDAVVCFMNQYKIDIGFDQSSIWKYLSLGYFPNDSSFVRNIHKVPPGGVVTVATQGSKLAATKQFRWFDKWQVARTEELSIEELHETINAAVREQLIGDVPIGVFLSGGVDSTLVSALAQKHFSHPIHSFSVGFENPKFDESKYAKSAAEQLGTAHHPFLMKSSDAATILEFVLKAYSEPLGDPSVLPTTFISKKAKEHVTVCLTGDGADELFYGYSRYTRFSELMTIFEVPKLHSLITSLKPAIRRLPNGQLKHRLFRLYDALSGSGASSAYISLVGLPSVDVAEKPFEFDKRRVDTAIELWGIADSIDIHNRLREIDVNSYLCDDILVKIDRAAMAFGLETRAPFLDSRVQEIARRCPPLWLYSVENKYILKKLLGQYVSSDIFRRPKMGFGAPLGEWFRSDLKDWSNFIVSETDWASLELEREKIEVIYKEIQRGFDKKATIFWALCALGSATQSIKL